MTDEKVILEIGKKKYDPIKKGRDQAEQSLEFSRWLLAYGTPIAEEVQKNQNTDGISIILIIRKAVEKLSVDSLIELFSLIYGCSTKEAEDYFDIGLLVEGVITVWDNQPGLRRVVNRFLSSLGYNATSEENSIQLEVPMDGQTNK